MMEKSKDTLYITLNNNVYTFLMNVKKKIQF